MKYRAEIDGLRALAVVPVILFHAGFELFSGGFVGVDVFFVISGYLITTILIEDIENNRFSIVNFYERRARRILPALFFVMLVCIPFAWVWMLPSQMKDFAQSLVAVSLFASNILFWRESGYFELTAEEKPLLHTWSLAVEEQYYVLFPIFLLLAWRFGKSRVFWLIVVMAAISLILSEWGWRKQPTANFYLAPTRAWELFAGSIAAFIVQKRGVRKSEVLSLLGLAAIIVAIFAFDETTPFPSVYGLVPVLGVVLFVLYAEKETLAAKILGTKAFVGIGLISYSAYLWHQPLFAFARIKLIDASVSLISSLSLVSLLLAYFSWKHIERPFRSKGVVSQTFILLFSLFGTIFFVTVGLIGHFEKTTPFTAVKLEGFLNNIDDGVYGGEGFEWFDPVEKPNLVLVGDSHAKQYMNALREIDPNTTLYAESACLSLPTLINEHQGRDLSRSDCINLHKRYINYIQNNDSVTTLIIAQRWGKVLFDLDTEKVVGLAKESETVFVRLKEELDRYFASLNELNIHVIIVGNVPSAFVAAKEMKKGYVDCINRFGDESCPKFYSRSKRENIWANDLLKDLSDKFEHIDFLDPSDVLCDYNNCWVVKDNSLVYADHAHLTTKGARYVINSLAEKYLNKE